MNPDQLDKLPSIRNTPVFNDGTVFKGALLSDLSMFLPHRRHFVISLLQPQRDENAQFELSWLPNARFKYLCRLKGPQRTITVFLYWSDDALEDLVQLALFSGDWRPLDRVLKGLFSRLGDSIEQQWSAVQCELMKPDAQPQGLWSVQFKNNGLDLLVGLAGELVESTLPLWFKPVAATNPIFLPLSMQIGNWNLPKARFRAMALGDALLTAHRRDAQSWQTTVSLPNGQLSISAEVLGEVITLLGLENMDDSENSFNQEFDNEKPLPDFENETIQIRATIEGAQIEIGQLMQLRPGELIRLPANARNCKVTLSAMGRRIGRGTLVVVGEQLAVQIDELIAKKASG